MQKLRERFKNKKGFTLVEMIVVLAIIGILIALVAPNVSRIIRDGQETSDAAKARTVLTAAQAYGTRQVAAGRAPSTTLGVEITGGAGARMVEVDDAAMKAFYANSNDVFMSTTGDAYLNSNVLQGTDEMFVYVSKEGVVMGAVYVNGTMIKAVSGDAPEGVLIKNSATGSEEPTFTTAGLKDGTFDPDDGTIVGPAPKTPQSNQTP